MGEEGGREGWRGREVGGWVGVGREVVGWVGVGMGG